jgi:hypothetical protein
MTDDLDDISGAINNEGEINMDIVTGVFYTRAKGLFKEVLGEVLDEYKKRLIKDGVSAKVVEKYRVKTAMHRKKPRNPETACIAKCKNGNECPNGKKEGYDYCGKHITREFKKVDIPSAIKKPEVVEKEEETNVTMEIIGGKKYLVFGNKIYNEPEGFDPEQTGELDEIDLEYVGNKKKNGQIEWLHNK